MLLRCLLIIPLVLGACASKPKSVGFDTIDPTYTLGGGLFDQSDPVIIAAAVRDFGGRQAICAARVNETIASKYKQAIENVLEAGRIELNGKTVLRNFRSLPLTRSNRDIAGSQAKCYATGESWTGAAQDIAIIMPIYKDRSARENDIEFRQRPVTTTIAPEPPTAPLEEPKPKPGQWLRSSS